MLFRLPVGWPLRRRLISWSVKRGFAAMNRSDVDLVIVFYEPDAEVWMRGMDAVGTKDRYIGHEGSATCMPTSTECSASGASQSGGWSTAETDWQYAPISSPTAEAAG